MHHNTVIKVIYFAALIYKTDCFEEDDLISTPTNAPIEKRGASDGADIAKVSSNIAKENSRNFSTANISFEESNDLLGFRPPLKPCMLNSDCDNKCCIYRFKSNGLCVDKASPGEVCGFGQEIVSTILMQVYKICDVCESGCCCGSDCCPTNHVNNQCCAVGYCTADAFLRSSTQNPQSDNAFACLECSSGCCCGEKKTCCLSSLCKGSRQGMWCEKCISGCCCGELCCASAFCGERPSPQKYLTYNYLHNTLTTNGFSLTSRPDLIHTTTALKWAPPPKYLPERSHIQQRHNYAIAGSGTVGNFRPVPAVIYGNPTSFFSSTSDVKGHFCWICHSLCCCGDSCCPKYVLNFKTEFYGLRQKIVEKLAILTFLACNAEKLRSSGKTSENAFLAYSSAIINDRSTATLAMTNRISVQVTCNQLYLASVFRGAV
uniref:Uncharacterized protein n=1 Tax=Romanomermis culicivorax TaxID=13658 RepID=A0A915JLC7_ROMCU